MKICKYPLAIQDEQVVNLPRGARVLTVQTQSDSPSLWALIDENETETEPRIFSIYATGDPTSAEGTYINTFQLLGGRFIGHVFETTTPPDPA
jgi:hypothetical protein